MSVITSVIGMLPLAAGQGSGSELYRGLGVVDAVRADRGAGAAGDAGEVAGVRAGGEIG
jgi:hypothetical protein